MKTKLNKTFVIVNKFTQEQWSASSGKTSWKQINHAKCAFANSGGTTRRDPLLTDEVKSLSKCESLKFDSQSVYEVVELKSDDSVKLDKIRSLVEQSNFDEDAEYLTTEEIIILEIKDIIKQCLDNHHTLK